MKAKIHVTLKQGILDPQGKAIEHALDSLGFKNAGNVRVGKYMELEVDEADRSKAEKLVKAMCEKLLANTIVEEYKYEFGVRAGWSDRRWLMEETVLHSASCYYAQHLPYAINSLNYEHRNRCFSRQ